jgi:hypothetical protein
MPITMGVLRLDLNGQHRRLSVILLTVRPHALGSVRADRTLWGLRSALAPVHHEWASGDD